MRTVCGSKARVHTGFLSEMLANVRRELSLHYYDYSPCPDLSITMRRPSLSRALQSRSMKPAIILELKHRSPGYGSGKPMMMTSSEFLRAAMDTGVEALSVIPQPEGFGGSLEEFTEVARGSPLPVLFKDFMISFEQMDAARACGASAVLLLARLELEGRLGQPITEMVAEAHRLGMEAVVEVHGEDEARIATCSGADVIGVNARDLETLAIDISGAERALRRLSGVGVPLVAMSGVRGPEVVRRYLSSGADAILVGTAFMHASDRNGLVRALRLDAEGW